MEQCANHVRTLFHCRDKAAYEVNLGRLTTVLLLTVDLTVTDVCESSAREWRNAERATTFEYWFAQADLIHIDVAGPIPVKWREGRNLSGSLWTSTASRLYKVIASQVGECAQPARALSSV